MWRLCQISDMEVVHYMISDVYVYVVVFTDWSLRWMWMVSEVDVDVVLCTDLYLMWIRVNCCLYQSL